METTQPETVATTPAPSQSTQSKKSNKKLLIVLTVLLIILVPLLALGVTAGVASSNLGKNNSLSKLSAFLPTERVPLLNSLGKSDYILLRDAFAAESDIDLIKSLGGRSQKYDSALNVSGTQDGRTFDGSLHMFGDIAAGKDADKGKLTFKVGGSIKSGIINVDLGQEGFKSDFLMPNKTDIYGSVSLTDDLIQTILPYVNSEGTVLSENDLKSYLNKYYKLNSQDLADIYGSAASPLDPAKQEEAIRKLVDALETDIRALYDRTLGDFARYSTITNEGRKSISGVSSIVLKLDIKSDKAGPVVWEFVDGLTTVLKNHKSELIEYCKSVTTEENAAASCDEESIDAMIGQNLTDQEKQEIEDGVTDFFNSFGLNDLRFFINPVDNTIMKSEGRISTKAEGLSDLSDSSTTFTKFEIIISSEETSRGKDIQVDAPQEYTDLAKLIEAEVQKLQEQMMSPELMQDEELMRQLMEDSEFEFEGV